MILHQHEAAQFRSEMAFDASWQWRQDRPGVRRDPALALVTGRAYRDHEVLHKKGFVTLEARPRWNLGRDHFFFNDDPRRDLAPATPLLFLCRFRRLGAFVHAAWFDIGATLKAFQTGDFFPQFSDSLRQGGDFSEQFNQQSLKLWTAQRGKGGGRQHMTQRVHGVESAQENNAGVPGLLPLLRRFGRSMNRGAS